MQPGYGQASKDPGRLAKFHIMCITETEGGLVWLFFSEGLDRALYDFKK